MCRVCGTSPCHSVSGVVADEPSLTVEDWEKIHWFFIHVYLPFMHNITADAREREGLPVMGRNRGSDRYD